MTIINASRFMMLGRIMAELLRVKCLMRVRECLLNWVLRNLEGSTEHRLGLREKQWNKHLTILK